ncbi:carboxypeptidase regulatory-like domain-containing protein [Hymenobacter sp. BT683]|uniref:Carboxypeptidase regulatory-like domain-containing protein n=1 Tax=Hymenobacter jeongseonensis TaxID=2791027 RepID=A0ABS0IJG4_9BACT|nr:carboxypeptidase-like regulatory domain-containing protein [Hymenobacter jeongseonensis]MBF9238481.1 carboxypeptidase regulatory-like domain-containing protein [Hymenobacter jeongseonensis]
MRSIITLAAASLFTCLSFFNTPAKAQTFASIKPLKTAYSDTDKPAPAAAKATQKMVLVGKITNTAGVLPGAVVIITATKQMAVTNADGEFQFVIPANSGPLQARVTYAGYADERMTLNAAAAQSTVNLANATVIVVARKQQLKVYLKHARKEIKHTLKQVHRHTA